MSEFYLDGGHCTLDVGERRSLLTVIPRGDSTLPLSVILQREDSGNETIDPTNTDTPLVAEVKFGSARVGDAVEVDLERGTILTLPWGRVEITAIYDPDVESGGVYPRQLVKGSAYVGARNGGIRPTRTIRLGVFDSSTRSKVVQVPKYAAEVAIIGRPAGDVYGGLLILEWLRAPNGRILGAWQPTSPTPVRIPNGTRAIEVVAPGITEPLLSLQFGLCL